ncbi:hypothetical protein EVAR_58568_1 [Eumeta japonica]|uniref:Uncharacterized protein n=1 Tax=Eumeta variegata TaxID=151549 RepID=A0A4C1Z7M1_EUMVA|nr:hypothetical protein EVAR_58568_1 [Eumeta japonica]
MSAAIWGAEFTGARCKQRLFSTYVSCQQGTSSEIADSHIHQGARSVKTTNTTSLDRPLSCNGQRATKTLLRQPQITTDRHACQTHPGVTVGNFLRLLAYETLRPNRNHKRQRYLDRKQDVEQNREWD